MNPDVIRRDLPMALTASLLVAGVAAMLALPLMASPWRVTAVFFGGIAAVAAVWISGNPRLCCLWGLMLTIPMALSKHFDQIIYKGGGEQSLRVEISDLFIFLLALYLVRDIYLGRIKGIRIPKVTWLWVLLMVMGIISVALGPWRTSGIHELVRMTKVILLFIVLTNELRTPRRIMHLVVPLAIGVLVQSGVAMGQYFTGNLLGLSILGETGEKTISNLKLTSVIDQKIFRPSGLLLHANILGIFCAVLLPLMIGAFIVKRGTVMRVFLFVTIASGMTALILTRARGAWVSFALAFFLMMALMIARRDLRARSMIATGAASVAVLGVVAVFYESIMTRLFGSQAAATIGREVFAADFWRLISDHWLFGVGLNSYSYQLQPYMSHSVTLYRNWIPPVHNIYYLWWAEQGLPGLVLHMLLWGVIVWAGIRNLRVRDNTMYTVNVACLAAMVAFFFDGFFSFSLRVNQADRLFFMLAAVVFAIHYLNIKPPRAVTTAPGAPSFQETLRPDPEAR